MHNPSHLILSDHPGVVIHTGLPKPNLFLCSFTLWEIINRHGCQVAIGNFKWIKEEVNHPAVRSMRMWMYMLN
jgi:hypothetical protein